MYSLSRRRFMTAAAAMAASCGFAPAHSQPGAEGQALIRRAGRIREALPAVGLGTFMTFDVLPGQPREHLRQVLQAFWQAGGRVIDTSPLYGMGETVVGDLASSLAITDQLFVTNKVWSTGEYLGDDSHAQRAFDSSLQRLWRERIDVMQCHSLVNIDVIVPLLKKWKAAGRIGYLGATHHEVAYFDLLAAWLDKGDLDLVQVHYSIHTRDAERRILPLAQERGIAVFVNMPLEKARLHKVVAGREVPRFAQNAGIATWSEFFLKWVLAHPAVTCVLPATANAEHARENMRAMHGPLPDPDLRRQMLRYMESVPGFERLGDMPWYPDKRYQGAIYRAQQSLK